MIRLFHATLRATAFLTRLPPAPRAFHGGPWPLGADAPAFPLVGLLAAAGPAVLLLAAGTTGLGPLPGAALAVLLLVALTGALHEDGLGDTADALFGHAGKDRALEIMKDSRVGTYGALALAGSLTLRVSLLADLQAVSPGAAALALLAAASGSRGAMAFLWSGLPTADAGGLADRVGRPSNRAGRLALLVGLLIALALGFLAGGPLAALLPPVLAIVAYLPFRRMLVRRLGGQTGDTLGAVQQITEIAMLLGFALAI